jgi:hypothetical protein
VQNFHTIRKRQDGYQELVFYNSACFACSRWGTYGFGGTVVEGWSSVYACGYDGYVDDYRGLGRSQRQGEQYGC